MTNQLSAGDEIPPDSRVIEVHVSELSQLFNSMDPSPFHERDLDKDAEEFIVGWSKELPGDGTPALLVHLDKPSVLPEAAKILSAAVRTHFERRAMQSRRRLHQLLRVGRKSLLIGLLFLTACLLAGNAVARLGQGQLGEIVRESFVIGGWVAMWRPLEIFLYEWWPIRAERQLFDRLSGMQVRIVCPGGQARVAGGSPS